MPRSQTRPQPSRFVVLAALCILVAALYWAREVMVPLAMAVLLTFLLAPLVIRLQRLGLPRVAAVVLVVAALLCVVLVLGWTVLLQVQDLAEKLPDYKDNIVRKVRDLRGSGSGTVDRAAAAIEEVKQAVAGSATQPATTTQHSPHPPATAATQFAASILPPRQLAQSPAQSSTPSTQPLPVRVVPEPPSPVDVLGTYLGALLGPLGTAGIVAVFLIFMLIGREDLRDRIIRLVGEGQLNVTTQALDDAATRISRYLVAQAIVNGSYGAAISLGLWLIGITLADGWFPSFVLWGLLCALLRFIPYIGPWIAAAFPLTLSLAVYPGYSVFFAVAAMFVIVELLSNNFMEPWLYGSSTGMSAVAVVVAAVFWTWLWGPIGLLLSTPLTVCIVVVGKYVPQFRFFDILLGDQPVLSPAQRIYQRLLAMDAEEATDVAEEQLDSSSLEAVYDQVLLPALAMAEHDRHADQLDDRRGLFIRDAVRDIVDELYELELAQAARRAADQTLRLARNQPPAVADSSDNGKTASSPPHRPSLPSDCPVNVVTLPAHDQADEIVGSMLTRLLELRGYRALNVSHNALASEMLDQIEQHHAQLVCVSALPPAAVTHARYLCKRLHERFPQLRKVVGLWTVKTKSQKVRQRIACAGEVVIAVTLQEAIEQISELAQPLAVRQAPN